MRNSRKTKKTMAQLVLIIPLLLYSVTVLGSLYYLIMTSLKSHNEYILNKIGFPHVISLSSYEQAITKTMFVRWFLNSVIVTFFSIIIGSFASILLSYAFSRFHFRFKKTAYALVSSLMVLPPIILIAPLYEIETNLKIINTYFGVIIVYVGWIIPFWTYFLTKFFNSVDKNIIDSAKIDGCEDFSLLIRIMIPLSIAPIITLALNSTLWVWSDLLISLIFLQKDNLKTLMVGLTLFKGFYSVNVPATFAGLIVATIPMLVFYAFGQRFFKKGVLSGAIKE